MNDISTLLRHAAETIETTPGADLADADLVRARRAASHLRTRRLATRGTGVAAVAVLVLAVGATTGTRGSSKANAVTLVSYTGAQPAGYIVNTVPSGWTVAKSDPSYLVIAAPGPALTPVPGTNTVISHEILVSWQADTGALPGSHTVKVGPATGSYGEVADHNGTMDLKFRDTAGHEIVIQLPPDLHWSASQAATFAEGVHVTSAVAYTGG